MGLLSRFQRPPATSAPERGETWRKSDFQAVAAGDDLHLVCTRGGTPFPVPSFAVDFLYGCRKFLPLEEHVTEHAARHNWGRLQLDSLRSWFPRLIEAGALISSRHVHERCAAMTSATNGPGQIEAVGFPTGGNRTALLRRALESFAENFREHGRTADLLISDGSANPDHRTAFRALAKTIGSRVLYAGEEEKRRYLATLAKRSGCDPAAIEFALFDPLGTGFACGANRNGVVLHGAGRMCSSVDDDVICKLTKGPDSPSRLSLFSGCDPFTRHLFPDRESAFSAADFVAQDYLAAHEAMLGRDHGALFERGLEGAALDLGKVGDELLHRLESGPARVRTTFTGHVGDPGIPTSLYYLHFAAENRGRLPHGAAEYRALFGSRSVLSQVANAAIGDASVSPGMAMGLDTRTLLPPFFPVLHAEDFVFGATVWQCCPHSVSGHLPTAIVHDPGVGKPILQLSDLGPERGLVIPEFAHLIRRVILLHSLPATADAATRTVALGRYLAQFGAMPARDFNHYLREVVLNHESEKIEWLAGEMRDDSEASEHWRNDVEAYLEQTRQAITHEDFDIPFDLKAGRSSAENRVFMQRLFAEFGRLLEQWPGIFEAARAMNERGEEPLFSAPA